MEILLVEDISNEKPIINDILYFLDKHPGIWNFRLGEPEQYEGNGSNIFDWDSFFQRLSKYRELHSVPADVFILLLTENQNLQNWFGMFDTNGNAQGFVQTSFWNELVYSESIYPILYEIVAIPLQWRMFKGENSIKGNAHIKPIGCINDYCEDKSDIILKLQTGNICNECYSKMINKGITEPELDYIDLLMDQIRLNFRVFNINKKKRKPSPLKIVNERKIYIGDAELKLSPIQKAIYFFFLKTDKGIRTQELIDYENELLDIYSQFYNRSDRIEMINISKKIAIDEDSITTQAISKINRKIDELIIPELADYYKINTDKNGYKTIKINYGSH